MNSGVYAIINNTNGDMYIGSSINIENRWKRHLKDLKGNYHHSVYLQRAWNKYGKDTFEFWPLFECQKDELLKYEQQFIDTLKPEYNMCHFAGNTLGYKFSKEVCEKLSLSRKGRRPWNKGKKLSEKHISNLSESHKGNVVIKKVYKGFVSPEGTKYRNIAGLKKFCEERGLSYKNMDQVSRGEKKSHKGWTRLGEPLCRFRSNMKA